MLFSPTKNPARSLYRFWDQFVPHLPDGHWAVTCQWGYNIQNTQPGSERGWGQRGWQAARIYSANGDTAIIYGKRYYRIDARFVLFPDGRFALRYIHGYGNRMALAQSTFLQYDSVSGQERWSVRPELDWAWVDDYWLDKQGHVPKRAVQQYGLNVLWELHRDPKWDARWKGRMVSDGWQIRLAKDQTNPFAAVTWQESNERAVNHLQAWLANEDRIRLHRIDLREHPRPQRERREPVEPDIDGLASHIIALLDVNQPANNVPHPKARRLQEAS